MSNRLNALLHQEDGSTIVELGIFVGLAFLTGAGFLYFSAGQFMGAFMTGGAIQ